MKAFFENGLPTMHRIREDMDRVFGGLLNELPAFAAGVGGPALNVWEHEDRFTVEAELPGFKLEDLDVSLEGDELTLRGERKAVQEDATAHRRERWVGKFERVLKLPSEVDAEKTSAQIKDGVLTLTLPKSAKSLARKIQVTAG